MRCDRNHRCEGASYNTNQCQPLIECQPRVYWGLRLAAICFFNEAPITAKDEIAAHEEGSWHCECPSPDKEKTQNDVVEQGVKWCWVDRSMAEISKI